MNTVSKLHFPPQDLGDFISTSSIFMALISCKADNLKEQGLISPWLGPEGLRLGRPLALPQRPLPTHTPLDTHCSDQCIGSMKSKCTRTAQATGGVCTSGWH